MTRVTVATAPLITAAQSVRGYKERQNVSELLADTLYTYQPDRNDTVAPGDIIRTRAEGFSYEVLAAGASGDVATAGGVKLNLNVFPDHADLALSGFAGSDLSALMVAAVNRAERIAAAEAVYSPIFASVGRPGGVTLTSGAVVKTWAPLIARGRLNVDASSLGGVSAFTVDGSSPPANLPSDVFEPCGTTLGGQAGGAMVLTGPGVTVANSTGVTVGATAAGPARENVRAKIDNMVLQDFNTGIRVLNDDTYLVSFSRVTVLRSTTAVVLGDGGATVNSGERLSATDCTFVGREYGVDIVSPAMNMNFVNCSFDFCRLAALRLRDDARFLQVNFSDCWMEESCDDGFVISELGASNSGIPAVNLKSIRTVPRTTSAAQSAILGRPLPDNGRPDGAGSQRTLFKGKMRLNIDGMELPYPRHNHSAENGLFLCDDDVRLAGVRAITFPEWRQIPHRKCISNRSWDFSASTTGDTNLIGASTFIYVSAASSLGFTLTDDIALTPSARSARFTASGSQNINVQTAPVRVIGQTLLALPIWHCAGTTGTLTSSSRLRFYDEYWRQADLTATATMDGAGLITCTTGVPHGLATGDIIAIRDTVGAFHRLRLTTLTSATEFVLEGSTTFSVPASIAYRHVSPATGRAVSTIAAPSTVEIASLYADADFVGFTGDRNWWIRNNSLPLVENAPAAAWVAADCTMSGLGTGDVVHLGGLAMAQWG